MSSVNIVNAAGLAAQSTRLLAGADAETILYAEQIRDCESRLGQVMDQIGHARTLREVISQRLNKLRQLESAVSAATDKDGKLEGEEKLRAEIEKIAGGDDALKNDLVELAFKGGEWKATVNVTDGKVHTSSPGDGVRLSTRPSVWRNGQVVATRTTAPGAKPLVNFNSSGQPVQAEIKRLEDEISQLDGDRQLLMVQVNQEINNKNKVINLLTNLLKAKNDAARMILSNLRPG